MDKRTKAKLSMLSRIAGLGKSEPETLAQIPALQSAFSELHSLYEKIRKMTEQAYDSSADSTRNKSEARRRAVELTIRISGGLISFAHSTKDNLLLETAEISPRNLKRMPAPECLDACKTIFFLAENHLFHLSDFGIDETIVDTLQAAIRNFESKIASPKNAITNRTVSKKFLHDLMEQADTILKTQIDHLVEVLPEKNEAFKMAYRNSRLIYGQAVAA